MNKKRWIIIATVSIVILLVIGSYVVKAQSTSKRINDITAKVARLHANKKELLDVNVPKADDKKVNELLKKEERNKFSGKQAGNLEAAIIHVNATSKMVNFKSAAAYLFGDDVLKESATTVKAKNSPKLKSVFANIQSPKIIESKAHEQVIKNAQRALSSIQKEADNMTNAKVAKISELINGVKSEKVISNLCASAVGLQKLCQNKGKTQVVAKNLELEAKAAYEQNSENASSKHDKLSYNSFISSNSTSSKPKNKSANKKAGGNNSGSKATDKGATMNPNPQKANLPIAFKNLGNSKQVILVTTDSYSARQANIKTFEKVNGNWQQVHSMTGAIGKHGFTNAKQEGDGKSPVGKYSIGTAFWRDSNPRTKLPYRQITANDIWIDDADSTLYNTWQTKQFAQGRYKSAENMDIPQYDYGFVINYNTKRVPKKGSAIFFHVLGSSGYTEGCTATSKDNVLKILRWLDPKKAPVIIQTPVSGLHNY